MIKKLKAGGTIDADAIARGIYEMMPNEYRWALKYGMLPAPIMESLKASLEQKAEDMAKNTAEKAFGFCPKNDCANKTWKAEFVSECMQAVTLSLYRVAPMVV